MNTAFFDETAAFLYSQLSPLYFLFGKAEMGLLGFEPRTKGL